MPTKLNSLEILSAFEEIFRAGVQSIKLSGLSGDDATLWKNCLESEEEHYLIDVREPSGANPSYLIEIKPRKKQNA